jgi:hypothetical protein
MSDLGRFTTKARGSVAVSTEQIVWYDKDGSITVMSPRGCSFRRPLCPNKRWAFGRRAVRPVLGLGLQALPPERAELEALCNKTYPGCDGQYRVI